MSLRDLFAFGLLCVIAMCLRADEPTDEMAKFQGTWDIASATHDGKVSAEMKGARVTFAKGKMTVTLANGTEQELPFKIDPTQKMKAIDFPLGGGGGWLNISVTMNGIYRFEGDTLTLCIGSGDTRPVDFNDTGATLVVLKRAK